MRRLAIIILSIFTVSCGEQVTDKRNGAKSNESEMPNVDDLDANRNSSGIKTSQQERRPKSSQPLKNLSHRFEVSLPFSKKTMKLEIVNESDLRTIKSIRYKNQSPYRSADATDLSRRFYDQRIRYESTFEFHNQVPVKVETRIYDNLGFHSERETKRTLVERRNDGSLKYEKEHKLPHGMIAAYIREVEHDERSRATKVTTQGLSFYTNHLDGNNFKSQSLKNSSGNETRKNWYDLNKREYLESKVRNGKEDIRVVKTCAEIVEVDSVPYCLGEKGCHISPDGIISCGEEKRKIFALRDYAGNISLTVKQMTFKSYERPEGMTLEYINYASNSIEVVPGECTIDYEIPYFEINKVSCSYGTVYEVEYY